MVRVVERRNPLGKIAILIVEERIFFKQLRPAVVGRKGKPVLGPLLDVNDRGVEVRLTDRLVLLVTALLPNCGNGTSRLLTAVVAFVNEVPGNNPANGFAVVAA